MSDFLKLLANNGIRIKKIDTPLFVIDQEARKVKNMPFKSLKEAVAALQNKCLVVFSVQEFPKENIFLVRGDTVDINDFNKVVDYNTYLKTDGILSGDGMVP